MSKKATWCEGLEDDIKLNFRKMSIEQMARYYNVSETDVTTFIARYKLRTKDIINTLTDDEVIFMYDSLLNDKIKCFRSGFYNKSNNYHKVIIKYLFNKILKYNRDDICQNVNTELLKEYKLGSMITCLKKKYN